MFVSKCCNILAGTEPLIHFSLLLCLKWNGFVAIVFFFSNSSCLLLCVPSLKLRIVFIPKYYWKAKYTVNQFHRETCLYLCVFFKVLVVYYKILVLTLSKKKKKDISFNSFSCFITRYYVDIISTFAVWVLY